MSSTTQLNPLETFLQDYADQVGGLWDLVEPQVYDLLLPEVRAPDRDGAAGPAVPGDHAVRVALDPEALADHPGCQFLAFGTPLLETVLADAQRLGRHARASVVGLNTRPRDLQPHLGRTLDLPRDAILTIQDVRPQTVPIAVFWFTATFVSDEKEQQTSAVAIDLHQGRQVRHLDRLLDQAHLYEGVPEDLPRAPCMDLREAYQKARERVVRTLGAAANTKRRALEARRLRQEARMEHYYRDLRAENEQRISRALRRNQDPARGLARRVAIDREEKLRLAELRKTSALRIHLRLTNLLQVLQPKVAIEARLSLRPKARPQRIVPGQAAPAPGRSAPVQLLWDPLVESLEAPACPRCARPTFALRLDARADAWSCPECGSAP